jgi:hypothetical protein
MAISSDKRAKDYDEIKPMIELCNAGRIFDVQAWIAAGKPVNPPHPSLKGARKKGPLQTAVDKGFHSLVQVLLEGGAHITDGSYNALEQALFARRLDLIRLLVEHGADINSVDITWVFDTWQPEIMEYFIDQGADVETGNPLATALCWKIKTALGVFKRHKSRFPSFQEQANIALRHHCREGNLKWVSLMLWAGADPFAKGPGSPEEDPDPEEDLCALEYAALYEHFDVFKLKKVRVGPDHPIANELLRSACRAEKADFLIELLKKGFKPADQTDHGSSLIRTCIQYLQFGFGRNWFDRDSNKNIDSSGSRETIKMIHILAKHGAKWNPEDRTEINDARRSLLKMTPDYTLEFVWIMSKYNGCSRKNIKQLLRTPTIKRHMTGHRARIDELLRDFPVAQEARD